MNNLKIPKFLPNQQLFIGFTIIALLLAGFILFLGTQKPFEQIIKPGLDMITSEEELEIPWELEFWYGDVFVTTNEPYNFANFVIRKTGHFFIYGLLGLVITIQQLSYKDDPVRAFLIAIFFIGVIGSIDELIQYFLPGRRGMILDVILNLNGSVIPLVWLLIRKR